MTFSKAQMKLMKKAAAEGSVKPFHSEWTAFYVLRKAGVMAYVGGAFTHVALTSEGRDALAKAAS